MTSYLISLNDDELDAVTAATSWVLEPEDTDLTTVESIDPTVLANVWLRLTRFQAQRKVANIRQAPPWPSFPTDRD